VALAVFAHIVMDGFDLGLGILFPLFHGEQERGTVMNSIAQYDVESHREGELGAGEQHGACGHDAIQQL
jgi:hypothetical protein